MFIQAFEVRRFQPPAATTICRQKNANDTNTNRSEMETLRQLYWPKAYKV